MASRGRKRKKKRKGSKKRDDRQSLLPVRKKVRHSDYEPGELKKIEEPGSVCPLCGKPVQFIAEAFSDEKGNHLHFDCVLAQLKEREQLLPGQKLSYMGTGCFGVFEEDDKGVLTLVRKIEVESREQFDSMKNFVEGRRV